MLTFDNLGEASEMERGTWDGPIGQHESVKVALPRLLDELDALGLEATFFVEGLNCELYPDALAGIVARGHELGVHGWRHETWAKLDAEHERELLTRAAGAFASRGLEARAFRPPGGEPTRRHRGAPRASSASGGGHRKPGTTAARRCAHSIGSWSTPTT